MQSRNFVVTRRPRLAAIKAHPKMDFADYERRLTSLQGALQLIQQAYLGTSQRALVVLEGWDTAGKGGVVRRLGWALDPRSFKVHPISAPNQHERAQHYLERFWTRLPEDGQIVLFDRSWYGRVLVERVEGFATTEEWRRAYREINEFERMLWSRCPGWWRRYFQLSRRPSTGPARASCSRRRCGATALTCRTLR